MLTLADMPRLARERIAEAAVLIRAGHYDTAVYLCGYAAEVAMQARICRTLRWAEFPGVAKEWQPHHAFLKVHDLGRLVKWSAYEDELQRYPTRIYWIEVSTWNPEMRYERSGTLNRSRAVKFLRATRFVADRLNPR